jgi:hypothetical protein
MFILPPCLDTDRSDASGRLGRYRYRLLNLQIVWSVTGVYSAARSRDGRHFGSSVLVERSGIATILYASYAGRCGNAAEED